jgi:hypothetical protein
MNVKDDAFVCRSFSSRIPTAFAMLPDDTLRDAVAGDWCTGVPVEDELLRHLSVCSDCSNDVLWYVAIRKDVDVTAYPCLHIAYASSPAANRVVDEHHGVYAIRTDVGENTGIVIGFCPWCALELNVSASPQNAG